MTGLRVAVPRTASIRLLAAGTCDCLSVPGEEWEAVEDLLKVHYLSREKLGDCQADDGRTPVHVRNDAADLRDCEAVWNRSQPQHDLVAVNGVHVEVDCDFGALGGSEPVQQRLRRITQL